MTIMPNPPSLKRRNVHERAIKSNWPASERKTKRKKKKRRKITKFA
jgi:hypothetical protein